MAKEHLYTSSSHREGSITQHSAPRGQNVKFDYLDSVIFVNENENGEKRENNECVNENYN